MICVTVSRENSFRGDRIICIVLSHISSSVFSCRSDFYFRRQTPRTIACQLSRAAGEGTGHVRYLPPASSETQFIDHVDSQAMAETPAPGGAGAIAAAQDLTRRVESKVHEKVQHHGGESGESTDQGSLDEMKEQERDEITYLARQISHISRRSSLPSGEPTNSFLDTTADPELDPNSESFNQKKWVKNLLHITSRDPETYPRRTAGVTFRNLNAYGFGTAADYQADVFNTWLKAFGYMRGWLGLRKKRRIDILRDFEGLVKSGEMLVVLGRPGRYTFFAPFHKSKLIQS